MKKDSMTQFDFNLSKDANIKDLSSCNKLKFSNPNISNLMVYIKYFKLRL